MTSLLAGGRVCFFFTTQLNQTWLAGSMVLERWPHVKEGWVLVEGSPAYASIGQRERGPLKDPNSPSSFLLQPWHLGDCFTNMEGIWDSLLDSRKHLRCWLLHDHWSIISRMVLTNRALHFFFFIYIASWKREKKDVNFLVADWRGIHKPFLNSKFPYLGDFK